MFGYTSGRANVASHRRTCKRARTSAVRQRIVYGFAPVLRSNQRRLAPTDRIPSPARRAALFLVSAALAISKSNHLVGDVRDCARAGSQIVDSLIARELET